MYILYIYIYFISYIKLYLSRCWDEEKSIKTASLLRTMPVDRKLNDLFFTFIKAFKNKNFKKSQKLYYYYYSKVSVTL